MKPIVKFGRREFIRDAALLAVVSSCSPLNFLNRAMAMMAAPDRLSYRAYRTTDFEGSWSPTEIEGKIPTNLEGTLFRIGPGAKDTLGTNLKHLFDGDALVTALRIQNGKVQAQSRFVETVERIKERQAGKMLYHDFGTAAPGRAQGFKNSPNVHIVNFAGKMLALSEAAAPVSVRPDDLSTEGSWNFHGTLPASMSFTAHPKLDPQTGDSFVYGITQGMSPQLKTFRFSALNGKLTPVGSYSLNGFYMIHDMMLTENYLIFVIPPIYVDMWGAATTRAPIAELLKFEANKPLRIVIMRKDGVGAPLELQSQPGGLCFHNINAYEEADAKKIIFDSILSDGPKTLELLQAWSQDLLPAGPPSWITRFEVDLVGRKILSRTKISDGAPTDFPALDPRQLGKKVSHYYTLEAEIGSKDPLAFKSLVCWNANTGTTVRVKAEAQQIFGEMVVGDWILHLGYDGQRDQTFLDVRQPLTLKLVARVWLGRYLPLGFHGSFN